MRDDNSNSNSNEGEESGLPKLFAGRWTKEEEAYTDALIQEFRAGNLPDVPEGSTLRNFLADAVSCHPKRISKKYEGKSYHGQRYNGRQQYWRNTQAISDEEAIHRLNQLDELRMQFKKSRDASGKKTKKSQSRRNSESKKTETTAKTPSIRHSKCGNQDDDEEEVPAASNVSMHGSISTQPKSSACHPSRKASPCPEIRQPRNSGAAIQKATDPTKNEPPKVKIPPVEATKAPHNVACPSNVAQVSNGSTTNSVVTGVLSKTSAVNPSPNNTGGLEAILNASRLVAMRQGLAGLGGVAAPAQVNHPFAPGLSTVVASGIPTAFGCGRLSTQLPQHQTQPNLDTASLLLRRQELVRQLTGMTANRNAVPSMLPPAMRPAAATATASQMRTELERALLAGIPRINCPQHNTGPQDRSSRSLMIHDALVAARASTNPCDATNIANDALRSRPSPTVPTTMDARNMTRTLFQSMTATPGGMTAVLSRKRDDILSLPSNTAAKRSRLAD